jgi:hypothetical protein
MATTPKSYGTILDFKVINTNHQRNGISGVPFTSVEFSYQERGGSFHPRMLAVVPDDANFEGGDVNVYVVDMEDTTQCWRGDNFSDAVRDALKAHRRSENRKWKKLLSSRKVTVA